MIESYEGRRSTRPRRLRGSRRAPFRRARPAIAAAIASPSPVPPRVRASSARVKRSNARGRKSGGKPGPSSQHVQLDVAVLARARSARPSRRRSVSALSTRFASACSSRAGSAWTHRRRAPGRAASGRPSARARVWKRPATRCEHRRRRRAPPAAPAAGPGPSARSPAGPRRGCDSRSVSSAADCSAVLELLARVLAAQRELELGAQDRQRRAQLVRGVGDERPLARERHLQPRRASRSACARAARSRRWPAGPAAARRSPPRSPRRRGGASARPAAARRRRARSRRREAISSASGPPTTSSACSASSARSRWASDSPTTTIAGAAARAPAARSSRRSAPLAALALGDHGAAARACATRARRRAAASSPAPGVVSSTRAVGGRAPARTARRCWPAGRCRCRARRARPRRRRGRRARRRSSSRGSARPAG